MRREPLREFVFKLALCLGRTVRELLDSIDSKELSEWIAYDRVAGLPDPWLQTGIGCAVMRNSLASQGRPAKPTDFMPIRLAPPGPKSAAENMAAMGVVIQQMKGK